MAKKQEELCKSSELSRKGGFVVFGVVAVV
jgi:hypothetical protein